MISCLGKVDVLEDPMEEQVKILLRKDFQSDSLLEVYLVDWVEVLHILKMYRSKVKFKF